MRSPAPTTSSSGRPVYPVRTLLRAGRVLHFARDYDAAVRVFTAALDRVPDSVVARFDLALSLAKSGEASRVRAREECGQTLASREGTALMVAVLGNAAKARGHSGEYDSARRILHALQAEAPMPSCGLAILSAAFGDTERPLEYWDAYDETMGLAKFCGFAPVRGSLSMFLDAAGLIVYFGLEFRVRGPSEAPALRALRARLTQ